MSSDLHHHQQIRFHSRLSWCCLFVSIPEIGIFGNAGLGAEGPTELNKAMFWEKKSILYPHIVILFPEKICEKLFNNTATHCKGMMIFLRKMWMVA